MLYYEPGGEFTREEVDAMNRELGYEVFSYDDIRESIDHKNMETVSNARKVPPINIQEWEEPIPLDAVSLPEFPTSALPKVLADYVAALSTFSQTPPEMAGALSLGILATGFQSQFTIEAKEGYIEPVNLYIAALAPPGERKSAIHGGLLAPVYQYEEERQQEEKEVIAANHAEYNTLEKRLEELKNKAAKGKCEFADVREAAAELNSFEYKNAFRLTADDVTPEKLVELMAQQNGTITLSSAEGGIFDTLAGRYDKMPNMDVFLKAHACERLVVDRIGRKQSVIDKPHLTVILTLQPSVIQGNMHSGSSMRSRGLSARFLYVVCNSYVGHRDVDPPPIPFNVKTAYHDFVRRILNGSDSGVIKLDSEARERYLQYAAKVEARLRDVYRDMPDWGGKLVGAMLRIAALIHAAEHLDKPTQARVNAQTIERAIQLPPAIWRICCRGVRRCPSIVGLRRVKDAWLFDA